MDPFAAVAVAATPHVGVAAEVVDRAAVAGTEVGLPVVVEWRAVEKEWPGARGVSVHTQLGTMSCETVTVEFAAVVVDLVASASEAGSLQECCFGGS